MIRPAVVALGLLVCRASLAVAAASLSIVEPVPGRYVSGPLTLRAEVTPADAAVVRVTLVADGRTVCTREVPPWACPWDAGSGVRAHEIRAVAVLADGSRLVDAVRTQASGFVPTAAAEVVEVATTVTDGGGGRVKGLGREAFRVFEDGERRELTHFIGQDSEREIVVAVDMSASMEPAMATCREAVRRFLGGLRDVDRVTLLAFNDAIFTVARREATPEVRLRAVDRLRAWGSTAFHDVVLRGLDLLDRHRGRRALVLFTDGEDMVSHATAQDVVRRIETSAVPVYVVAQGRGMREAGLKRTLDRIAAVGGGRAFYTDRIEELDGAFSEIAEDLASQYLLAYDAGESAEPGRWRTIRVEVAGRGYAVRARQGYRVPARRR
jgi:Ca-activated chloride channel family protein